MTMQGRFMLKSEAIEWNAPWSQRDRARIAAALEAIPGGKCIRPSSGERIGVWANGHLALKIYPGYLVWPGKSWTEDLPPDLFPDMQEDERDRWHGLSTFQDRGL